MKNIYLLIVIAVTLIISGCSTTREPIIPKKVEPKKFNTAKYDMKYNDFKTKTKLKSSYKIYKNKELLSLSNSKNTKIEVDVSEQRARLLVYGAVAVDTPCTTGAKRKLEPNTKIYRDKRTPYGTFKVMEKIKTKRSNIFGVIYKNGIKVYRGDRRKYKGSKKGTRYVGAPLFHWMRLTGDGIGLHESKYIKRHPGTNGCVRLPKSVAPVLFSKISKGGTVTVKP